MEADVSVQEVMDRGFVGVSESDGLREAVELMVEEAVESVVVLRGSEPVGVLTERNALAHVVDEGFDGSTVSDAMANSVPTVDPDVTLATAADMLSARGTHRLVVTDGEKPVGIVTERDLMSTSPFRDRSVETEQEVAAATNAEGEAVSTTARESTGDASAGFEDQAICEACGSLARDLMPFNGQLLCADCRDI